MLGLGRWGCPLSPRLWTSKRGAYVWSLSECGSWFRISKAQKHSVCLRVYEKEKEKTRNVCICICMWILYFPFLHNSNVPSTFSREARSLENLRRRGAKLAASCTRQNVHFFVLFQLQPAMATLARGVLAFLALACFLGLAIARAGKWTTSLSPPVGIGGLSHYGVIDLSWCSISSISRGLCLWTPAWR